ncbi:MAG: fibronectin type III domain-containing protein, partial [Mariniphaga sp.]
MNMVKQPKKSVSGKVHRANPPATKTKSVSTKPLIIGTAAIAVIVFITFSPCLSGNFLGWDDYNYIRDNVLIRVFSWDNILHIFNYKTFVVGNYHPLTILSYVIEYQLTTGGTWAIFADGTNTDTTATIIGLSNGTSYDFRVKAVNIIGPSIPSLVVTATPGEP